MADKRKIDQATQTETTGHEWDGITELDTPMPRWWLWTFYTCIIWGIGYVIMMPAWPLIHGATTGLLGYSSRGVVAKELAAQAEANGPLDKALLEVDVASIADNAELQSYATAGGGAVFRNHCSQCHGAGAEGAVGGYPSLLDDDWLWGGTVEDIVQTVTHGIRYEADDNTRYSEMPAFGDILEPEDIDGLTQYVLSLSGNETDAGLAAANSEAFADNCAACHNDDGKGMRDQGAPDLTDTIWLYGGDQDAIRESIEDARYGIMPAFEHRLTPAEIRKVAVYVNTLGGGE